MNTNSRLGKIIPATSATVFLLALGSAGVQAETLEQNEATSQPSLATQPQPLSGAQGNNPVHGAAKFVSDSVITAKVKAVLLRDESLKSLKIHVETRKGVVRLSGDVANRSEAMHAIQVAQAVGGVKLVMSDLHVQG